ncbi:MAG: PTS sugar transporter subunit IIA [Opitutales bacterium]|nr:PTS sugar transporter subunit IIA [Opitutales bacterium]
MRLDRYISKARIIELESTDLEGALKELIAVSTQRLSQELPSDELVKELIERENTMSTYLGNGVAMPHVRAKMKRPYIFAIGRCREGLDHEGVTEYKEVRLVFLLLASESEKNYLNVLASLARLFREKAVVDHIVDAPNLRTFQQRVYEGFGGLLAKPERRQNRFNRLLLREAEKVARSTRCSAILIFSDTFAGGIEITDGFPEYRSVLVSRAVSDRQKDSPWVSACIEVRSFSQQRLSQLRSAIIIGLTRNIFKFSDRVCCIGGLPSSNQLDTLIVVDIEREFQSVMTQNEDLLPKNVKIEVVERMLAIATELAVEGREGKPVGSLFVVGNTEVINPMIKPLVLNPFYGYKEEDRNVLNPFMDETIKEFSVIDGCFVIRGDGVIESAGSLIHAPSEFYQDMPGGFGSRHSAAAAISRATDCLAIVVSASTGQVSLFRNGDMVPLLEKPLGGTA